jgi:hypothetical protein
MPQGVVGSAALPPSAVPHSFGDKYALAEAQHQLIAEAEHALQFGQRLGRHQHLLVDTQHAHPRQVAHGQAVRVGGHEPQTVFFGREQYTGEHLALFVGAGSAHHLAQCLAKCCCVDGDCTRSRLGDTWVIVDRHQAHAELRPASGDLHIVVVDRHFHRAIGQGPHDVGCQLGRNDRAAVELAANCQVELDRELEVGAGDREVVARQLEA